MGFEHGSFEEGAVGLFDWPPDLEFTCTLVIERHSTRANVTP
jgi:hypothetical protein